MTSLETVAGAAKTWLQGLVTQINLKNSTITDGSAQLRMPRDKDLIVTFPEDATAEPEQMPAMVLELGGTQWQKWAPPVGVIEACLYLADDASSGVQARLKLIRWMDVIRDYCSAGSSVVSTNIRFIPRRESYVMGKAKGDMNAFQAKVDLVITF